MISGIIWGGITGGVALSRSLSLLDLLRYLLLNSFSIGLIGDVGASCRTDNLPALF